MDDAELNERKSRLEDDLVLFVEEAWSVLEPGTQFQPNWHIHAIGEFLTAARRGQIRRGIINIPPRHMKSLLTTVNFPCWIWSTEPEKRFMFASYSGNLSQDHSVLRRSLLLSEWYQELWSDRVQLASGQNLKTQFANRRGGRMIATSVGGTATGRGGEFVIVDDPHSAQQALSEAHRQRAIKFFDQTLTTRLNDPKTGVILIIMQRLHEADLTGHLLAKGGWEHLKLPAEAEERERIIFAITGEVHDRMPGEALWPERFPKQVLEEQKISMGSYAYAGQMQQNPAPLEGAIIKREWIKFYRELPKLDIHLQSWDCTFKETKDSDFVVGQVWARAAPENPRESARYYLIDQVRARMDFVATKNALRTLSESPLFTAIPLAAVQVIRSPWTKCSARSAESDLLP